MDRREEEINSQQEEIVNVREGGNGRFVHQILIILLQFQLQLQLENLKATNVDSKRLQRELQGQIRTLCGERTNLITRIQDQHTEIVALKRQSSGSATATSSEAAANSTISESAAKDPNKEQPPIDKSAKNDKSNDIA